MTKDAQVVAVIPTHNRPKDLTHALESVLAQDVPGLAVAVVDEASSPPAVVPADPRITLIRHDEALGPAAARNRGAAAVDAEVIAFLDDDDRWLPGKLKRCLEVFAEHPEADVVFHRVAFAGASRVGTGCVEVVPDPLHRMLRWQPPHLDGVLVRQRLHLQEPFDPSFGAAEDLDYLIRLSKVARFVEIDEVLAEHGPSEQRASSISLDRRIAARERLFAKHAECFDQPEYVAFHLARLGHLKRRQGRRAGSAALFLSALRHQPISGLAWRGLLTALLPVSVVRRLSR